MDDENSVLSPCEEIHARDSLPRHRKPQSGVTGGVTRGQITGEALEAACSLARPGNTRQETAFFQLVLGHSQAVTTYAGWVCAMD